MTAKEKAMEIAMKYDKYGETDNAVKCALICVDEILETPLHVYGRGYWENVKQEIEKL
jgi:hypothetical protein